MMRRRRRFQFRAVLLLATVVALSLGLAADAEERPDLPPDFTVLAQESLGSEPNALLTSGLPIGLATAFGLMALYERMKGSNQQSDLFSAQRELIDRNEKEAQRRYEQHDRELEKKQKRIESLETKLADHQVRLAALQSVAEQAKQFAEREKTLLDRIAELELSWEVEREETQRLTVALIRNGLDPEQV